MNIFLSRPSWTEAKFTEGIETFTTLLSNMGLTPKTLGITEYPSKAPLDEVIEMMRSCKGAIILGLPQIYIDSGKLKDKPIESNLSLATEWNHIEAALAYATNLPLLIIHHDNISRGVFDRGVMNAFVHSTDMTQPHWGMNKVINGALLKWKSNCVSGNANLISAKLENMVEKPYCPNCSTPIKKIFMSPISSVFTKVAGGNWQCHICNFVTE